jgi:hypothetical protein
MGNFEFANLDSLFPHNVSKKNHSGRTGRRN